MVQGKQREGNCCFKDEISVVDSQAPKVMLYAQVPTGFSQLERKTARVACAKENDSQSHSIKKEKKTKKQKKNSQAVWEKDTN